MKKILLEKEKIIQEIKKTTVLDNRQNVVSERVSKQLLKPCKELELSLIIKHLFNLCKQLNLELSDFTTSNFLSSDFLQEHGLSMIIKGRYGSLISFLKNIHSVHLLTLQNFELYKLKENNGKRSLEMVISLKIYCLCM